MLPINPDVSGGIPRPKASIIIFAISFIVGSPIKEMACMKFIHIGVLYT